MKCITFYLSFLQSNNITEIPSGAFGKLPVVFELHLRNNQISNIRFRLPSLSILTHMDFPYSNLFACILVHLPSMDYFNFLNWICHRIKSKQYRLMHSPV